MSRAAKATLLGAIVFCSFTVWGVHYQQLQERETMYKGVLKDDVRRKEKMQKREEDLQESIRKRELYERVQKVTSTEST